MPHPFARRTFDTLKKDAKRCARRIASAMPPRGASRPGAAAGPAVPTLRDVQLAVAREQGFEGWTALKRALEPDAAASAATWRRYQDMAQALLEAYRTGTPEAMERHYGYTWHRRVWSTIAQLRPARFLGGTATPGADVKITLDDARYLVARERGVETWDAARASAARLPRGSPHVTTVAQAKSERLREALANDATTELDLLGPQGHHRRRPACDRRPDAARAPRSVGHVDHRRRPRAPRLLPRAARRQPRLDAHRRRRPSRPGRQAAPPHVSQRPRRHRRRNRPAARVAGVQDLAGRRGAARTHQPRRLAELSSCCAARSPIGPGTGSKVSTASSRSTSTMRRSAITAAGIAPLRLAAAPRLARVRRQGRLDAVHRGDAAPALPRRRRTRRPETTGSAALSRSRIDRIHLGPALPQPARPWLSRARHDAGAPRAVGELSERRRRRRWRPSPTFPRCGS